MGINGIDPALTWCAIVGSSLIFATSGALKLRGLQEFRDAVAGYRILPELLAGPFAVLVAAAELTLAIALLLARTRIAAALGLLLLLTIFTLAIALNLMRGRRDVDCGCFGFSLRQSLTWWLPFRNLALAGIVAVVLFPANARPLNPLDLATAIGAAAMLAILYYGANYALANALSLHAMRS